MKNTWFSIGFIVSSSWPYYKGGSKLVAWPFKELALDFMHTCSKINSRQAKKLRKALGSRKKQSPKWIQVRKQKQENFSGGRIIRIPQGRTIRPNHSVNPTRWRLGQTLTRSILQRACFTDWKMVCGIGLSDGKELKVGQRLGWFFREGCFLRLENSLKDRIIRRGFL